MKLRHACDEIIEPELYTCFVTERDTIEIEIIFTSRVHSIRFTKIWI